MDEDSGRVDRFVEKSADFVGNKFNAGIYLLNPSVLDRIDLRPTSLEKEVFPKLASDKLLYAMVLPGFWMDIGEPKDYITGQRLYLDSLRKKASTKLAAVPRIIGNVLIHETAVIGEKCLIGPDVAIGPGCVIEYGVVLSGCTVMQGAHIKKNSCILNSIIGRRSIVGQRALIDRMTVIGEDVHVSDEANVRGGLFLS
ncbi:hypothetical protein ZIOFF_058136 [Zingiber officinale]|uniref:Nucleotidyl transferase domain-containing protein n=2 Tax=Zingiber officinale TaxID=94328 RepID=A0A8J5KJ20_ZINOF|nr:hypothetical protein ZIOFF_058136 [Zingiber officinale]